MAEADRQGLSQQTSVADNGSSPVSMHLFDRSDEYDSMLAQGLRLTGEDKAYFLAGRIADLQGQLRSLVVPRRILDFGCGIGDSAAALAREFPDAMVVGTDGAERALVHAHERYASARVSFRSLEALEDEEPFDLCYVNGVFHRIVPGEREAAIRMIERALRRGGLLALFENNPWNPGTRLVMSRVPFDRNAQTLSHREVQDLLRGAGFPEVIAVRFLFFFPRFLRALRVAEPWLARLPLGAQYYVLARHGG